MYSSRAFPQTAPIVAGNIKSHIDEWVALGTTPITVQNWIREGISIPFLETPEPFTQANPAFTATQSDFITQEITQLVKSGAVVKCDRDC